MIANIIRVNEDWVIAVDPLNYTPMKDYHREILVKQKDGTEKLEPAYGKPLGFYTSLAGAVKAIARADYKEALSGRETPLNEAVKLMQETLDRFEKILEGIKE